MLGFDIDKLEENKAIYTATEICQQPMTWQKTIEQMAGLKEELSAFLAPVLDADDHVVILTGAGTSEYVGNALQPSLYLPLKGKVRSFGTTDIVASPHTYLSKETPTLLVSFARSGDSPESVGAVQAADAVCDNVRHLFITCNKDGALAKAAEERDNCFAIILTDETNDKSFAMTSSFTNMYLAALLTFLPKDAELEEVLKVTELFLAEHAFYLQYCLKDFDFDRIVYLGTDALKGIAQESALKMLELTAGAVATFYDSPVGFRHGPKAAVNDRTLTVVYLSDLPETRRYEMDLLKELARDRKGNKIIVISDREDEEAAKLADLYYAFLAGECLPNRLLALPYITAAQCLALFKSQALGITTDDPVPTGEVNRVVKGVTIYEVEK